MTLTDRIKELIASAIYERRQDSFEPTFVNSHDKSKVSKLIAFAVKERLSKVKQNTVTSVKDLGGSHSTISMDPNLLRKAEEALKTETFPLRTAPSNLNFKLLRKKSFDWESLFLLVGLSSYCLVLLGLSWFLAGLVSSVMLTAGWLIVPNKNKEAYFVLFIVVGLIIASVGLIFRF